MLRTPAPLNGALGCIRTVLALCCTKKALDQFRIKPETLSDPDASDSALGHWYVNIIQLGRKKAALFMSERALLSFVIFGMRKDNSKDLPELFLRGLTQLLEMENFSTDEIERCLPRDGILVLAKTSNRKALGNLNDLAGFYDHAVYYEGGLEKCDLWGIIQQANRTPQRNLDWAFSIETARELVSGNAT